jgi:quinol-cytochrome oxidoreductase complex cytochrome b subunit
MGNGQRATFKNPVISWIDERLPVFTLMQKEYGTFPTPKNFNYFWSFGGIAMTMLILMIVTGIFLAMHYTPQADMAFNSVEHIMRDVNYGWMLRYLHMNGASFFFIAVYIHIFRGMYYGSYKKPRELLWILGVIIFLLMMATAFMGYTLPWSQMGGWAATVITNLFTAIPVVGPKILSLLLGGFSVDNPTLNRFFALHFLLPFVIFGIVFIHVWALHISGSNNPLGIDVKGPQDTLPFNPYYTVKDMFGLAVFMLAYVAVTFFAPNMLSHPDHYVQFNPLQTPAHIVPEWYFLPFYAILRAITFDIGIPFTSIVFIPAKLGGVIAMFGSIALLLVLPWLDTHPVRSARFRPQFRLFLLLLVAATVTLGYVGAQLPEGIWVILGQLCTAYYFGFFLIILPILSRREVAKPLPSSINEAVLKEKSLKAEASI